MRVSLQLLSLSIVSSFLWPLPRGKAAPSLMGTLPDVRIASSLAWIEAPADTGEEAGFELGDRHPLTQRLQFWVDALDEKLRRRPEYHEIMAAIPRPRVQVLRQDSVNAFASSATVCFKVPVRIKGPRASFGDEEKVISISPAGKVGFYRRSQVACLEGGQKTPEEVLTFYRENLAQGPCRLRVEESFLWLEEGCELGAGALAAADTVLVKAQSSKISLHLGLVRLFEEESQLLYSLLHELAHFYRAHGALNKKAYNYFYRLGSGQLKPDPDPALDSLGQKLLELPSYRIQMVAGQRWHSEIFSYARHALHHLVKPACTSSDSPCFQSCEPLRDLLDSRENLALFGRFPAAPLPEEAKNLYFRWEENFSACLSSIGVSRENPEPNLGKVSLQAAKEVFWWGDEGRDSLVQIAQAMNQKFFDRDRYHAGLLQSALNERLGYYTTEEEADILALRWLALLGVEVQSAVDHWLIYGDAVSGQQLSTDFFFSADRCRDLYEAEPRWSEGGQIVPVPIGVFSEPHHSSCFRTWRMEQAVSGHVWELGPSLWDEAEARGGPYAALRLEAIRRM